MPDSLKPNGKARHQVTVDLSTSRIAASGAALVAGAVALVTTTAYLVNTYNDVSILLGSLENLIRGLQGQIDALVLRNEALEAALRDRPLSSWELSDQRLWCRLMEQEVPGWKCIDPNDVKRMIQK